MKSLKWGHFPPNEVDRIAQQVRKQTRKGRGLEIMCYSLLLSYPHCVTFILDMGDKVSFASLR
jgi:hypothetical protein